MTRTITITSGKGGVGKTNISVNLALHLATLGCRTCLFDADLGLANINILLGLNPEYNLEDVFLNHCALQDIIIRNYKGIDIIPGSSGVEEMANLEEEQVDRLIQSFSELDEYDFLLFDTSAGVSRSVISFCLASSEVVLIITPEPTSLTDAYALLKILSLNGFSGTVKIVVNQCKSIPIAKLAYNKFKETVQKYLPIDVKPLGIVIQDHKVVEAVKAQQALISLYPESNASRCIKNLTKHLLENQPENLETAGMVSFWSKWLQLIKSPLNLTGSKKAKKEDKGGTAPESPAGTGGIANLGGGLYPLMNKLVDSVSSVSQELRLVRKAIDKKGQNRLGTNGSVDKDQDSLQSEPILLDFDAFLNQRGTTTGEKDNK